MNLEVCVSLEPEATVAALELNALVKLSDRNHIQSRNKKQINNQKCLLYLLFEQLLVARLAGGLHQAVNVHQVAFLHRHVVVV